MSLMVLNGQEMVRYNPTANTIEYSNRGTTWFKRCNCSGMGTIRALTMHKGEILLCSDRGVYFSKNGGCTWFMRDPTDKEFTDIQSMGNEVMGITSDGRVYVSSNGFCWFRRK